MSQVDQAYKEMWENGTWTPEYKDSRFWPQCCGFPMARHNELSRAGHRCYICLTWRPEQQTFTPNYWEEKDVQDFYVGPDNGPCDKPFTPPAHDKAF